MYQGLAAVPLHFWFGRFKKSFFLHPTTYELYGRVGVRPPDLLLRAAAPLGYYVFALALAFCLRAMHSCHTARSALQALASCDRQFNEPGAVCQSQVPARYPLPREWRWPVY